MTLSVLVKKEFLGHLLSLRFTIVSCGLLAVMAAFSISQSLAYLEQVEEYGSGDPGFPEGSSDQQVIVVDQPPSLLRSLLGGSFIDRIQRLALVDGVPHVSLRRIRDPMEVLFPSGDLAFVLGTVVSLLAIIMSYDSLCGERESGTLRLLLSYGVGRDQILLSKWAGGMLALSAPFAVGVCLCAVLAGGLAEADIGRRDVAVILSVAAVSVIYMGVVFALGVLVSVLADRQASAMAILLSVWALQVGLLPGLVPQLVAASGAWPSAESIEREKREILNQLRADESALVRDPRFGTHEEVQPGLFLLGLNDAGKTAPGGAPAGIKPGNPEAVRRLQPQDHEAGLRGPWPAEGLLPQFDALRHRCHGWGRRAGRHRGDPDEGRSGGFGDGEVEISPWSQPHAGGQEGDVIGCGCAEGITGLPAPGSLAAGVLQCVVPGLLPSRDLSELPIPSRLGPRMAVRTLGTGPTPSASPDRRLVDVLAPPPPAPAARSATAPARCSARAPGRRPAANR